MWISILAFFPSPGRNQEEARNPDQLTSYSVRRLQHVDGVIMEYVTPFLPSEIHSVRLLPIPC